MNDTSLSVAERQKAQMDIVLGTDGERAAIRELQSKLSGISSYINVGRVHERVTERVYASGNIFMRSLTQYTALVLFVTGVVMLFTVRRFGTNITK
jgi:hypothetical protein